MSDILKRIEKHRKEYEEILPKIEKNLIALVNELANKDEQKFFDAIREWLELRKRINNEENIGIMIGFKATLITYPLAGDHEKDQGQTNESGTDLAEKLLAEISSSEKKKN